VEAWVPGIRLLSRWHYFDQPEPRLGAFRLMRYFPFIANMVRIVHYRLGEMGAGEQGPDELGSHPTPTPADALP
jgi:hypothetical protein